MLKSSDSIQTVSATPQRDSTWASKPLAWRITQNMQGCSPARIDSVIQHHLPKRTIRWSQQPDTLEIPGLEGYYTWQVALNGNRPVYDQGFFRDNPLLHAEVELPNHGRTAEPVPYALWRDDWVSGSLLACALLLAYALRHSRYQLRKQLHDFFYKPHERPTMREAIVFDPFVVFISTLLLSLMGGMVAFVVAQNTLNLFLSQVSPYLLLFIYLGCFMGYFLMKRVMEGFVNWVFFDRLQRSHWRETSALVVLLQCCAILPLALVFVYFRLTPVHALWALAGVIVTAKAMLAYKAYRILFPRLFLVFHLFLYLCTLEIMPLLAFGKILEFVTDNLIFKY